MPERDQPTDGQWPAQDPASLLGRKCGGRPAGRKGGRGGHSPAGTNEAVEIAGLPLFMPRQLRYVIKGNRSLISSGRGQVAAAEGEEEELARVHVSELQLLVGPLSYYMTTIYIYLYIDRVGQRHHHHGCVVYYLIIMAQVRQRVSRVEGGVTVGGMGVDVLNEAQWTMVPAMRVEGLMLGYRDREQVGRETEPAARPSSVVARSIEGVACLSTTR